MPDAGPRGGDGGSSGGVNGGSDSGGSDSGGSDSAGGDSKGGSQPGGISVSVTPTVAHLAPGATLQFSASVTGSPDSALVWSVKEGAAGGSVSATGLYSAPTMVGNYHVVATSHALATASASATVFVNSPGDCSNLPAVGKWESIAPVTAPDATSGKNYSEAIVVDPFDPATVWLGTGFAGIFKSTNCGATWTHVNTGRNAAAMDNGSHGSMAVDPVDAGTMYTTSLFGAWGLWKTTNGGVDWDQVFGPESEVAKVTQNSIDAISMDPTDHKHLVIGMHTNCAEPYAPTCQAETKDSGATWKIIKTPNAMWEEGAGPWVLGAKSWLYAGLELYLTVDSGSTWSKVTPAGAWSFSGGEVQVHTIPQGTDGTYYLASSQGIVKSGDGKVWSLVPNFSSRVVGFAVGNGSLYASDQWSAGYYTASQSNPDMWTKLPAPMLPEGSGAPYLAIDSAHHVLYSSNFNTGLWREVTP